MSPQTIRVSLPKLASLIDHSLLHPTLTDADLQTGLALSKKHNVAAACVKPYAVPLAKQILANSPVKLCSVIGFPHGNSSTHIKISETLEALEGGATEIDMVINIGKALGQEWHYIEHEVEAINRVVTSWGAILKVIFENDYLQDEHIIRLCEICTALKVSFVKTSTGYGFVKQADGSYNYKGATSRHLRLMREHTGPEVQIKAAGGVRTLDDLLHVMTLGVTRVGATATEAILEEAVRRGIGMEEMDVSVEDRELSSGH